MRFVLWFLALSFNSYAGNIVVMTSLDVSEKDLMKIEGYAEKYYQDRQEDLVIIHRATPKELYDRLTDSDTEIFLWVSHSAQTRELNSGLRRGSTILDLYGNNVANFFSRVNDNLKFLAIVGCESKSILDEFKNKGYYRNNNLLKTFSFHKKTKVFRGLKKAIKASLSAKFLETESSQRFTLSARKRSRSTIRIGVDNTKNNLESWILIGDFVFPLAPESIQSIEINKEVFVKLKSKNIKLIRDIRYREAGMNQIRLWTQNFYWEPFFDFNQKPIGENWHLYIYPIGKN